MIRLTDKNSIRLDARGQGKTSYTDIYFKLKNLEDIEEERGIDLSILFKVIKYSVFVKCWDGSIDEVEATIGYIGVDCVLQFNGMMNNDHKCYYPYTTKDYGKTWALTREELENENNNNL